MAEYLFIYKNINPYDYMDREGIKKKIIIQYNYNNKYLKLIFIFATINRVVVTNKYYLVVVVVNNFWITLNFVY